MPTKFDPNNQDTWPPLGQPVLWAYRVGKTEYYMVADLEVMGTAIGSQLWFNPQGINGYDYDCELWEHKPHAWQPIPSFNTEPSND